MNNTIYRSSIPWLILFSDIIGFITCLNLVFFARFERLIDWYSPLPYGLILTCLLGVYLADSYKSGLQVTSFWSKDRLFFNIIFTIAATTSAIYLAGLWGQIPLVGINVLLPSLGLFTVWAIFWRFLAGSWMKQKVEKSRWLILAAEEKATQLGREYKTFQPKAELVFLVTKKEQNDQKVNGIYMYGLVDTIDTFDVWNQQPWSGVVIDKEYIESISQNLAENLMRLRLQGVPVYTLADFYEQFWQKVPSSLLKEDWFVFKPGFSLLHSKINVKIKRLMDIVAAGSLLIATLPLMLVAAIAIKLDSKGSIFYHQVRTGLNGETFKVHKFRSMYEDAEKRGAQWTSNQDPRITRVGSILRIMRIDELPQLWNVLKGEMSLIGPRPERPEFDRQLREQIPYYDVRYSVKPGITGWAQVSYSYGASVEDAFQKLSYDIYYIKNYSLLIDLAIAFKTVQVVILGKGR